MRLTRLVPAALAAAVIAAVSLASLPAPAGSVPAVTREVAVTPTPLPLACPGPLEVPVGDIDTGDADLDAGSDDRQMWTSAGGPAVGDGVAIDGDAASQLERVGGGDVAGLAALSCVAPAQDQWLVAGSTSLGASARLVLSNTSDASVRARVSLYGPVGAIGDVMVVTVAPGGQQSILLESIETEVPALAVHVSSGGVGVGAVLQDSRLDGFVAAGTDWATPAAVGTALTVPVAGPVTADAPATLRLVAPEGATVSLGLRGTGGTVPWLGEDGVTLEPGAVTDLALPVGGQQAVVIEADAPVAAAASVTVARDAPADTGAAHALDLAWTPAQAPSEEPRAVVVPPGDVTVLATPGAAADLTLTDQHGDVVLDEAVAADAVGAFRLDVAEGTVLHSTSAVGWAVRVADTDAGFVTVLSPAPTTVPDRLVEIAPGPYVGRP